MTAKKQTPAKSENELPPADFSDSGIAGVFSGGGSLARAMPGYRPRAGQAEMARAVEESAARGGRFVFEAGAGIGKTFAYLAPILQNNWSAVISTGTRALQDQLFLRDIPFLEKALGRKVRAAVLKGRANYLCRRNIASGGAGLLSGGEDDDWAKICAFANKTKEGDIRAAEEVAADSPAWQAAVSTRENCPVQKCEHYGNCFLYSARARARDAEIVIVNHHLFLADMRLKEEGVAEILPSRDVLLFDEAHLLPQLAPKYLGDGIGTAQMMRLVKQTGGDFPSARALRAAVDEWLRAIDGFGEVRMPREQALSEEPIKRAAAHLLSAMQQFAEDLISRADENEIFANCGEAAKRGAMQFAKWLDDDDDNGNGNNAEGNNNNGGGEEEEEVIPLVRWLEKTKNNSLMHTAPLSGRVAFARQWENCRCVVFTSATLSVGGGFGDFAHAVAAEDAPAQTWESPYDFAGRARLFLPPDMPPPNTAEHAVAAVSAALPLILANGGRAFVLFSSWRALDEGARALCDSLPGGYRVLKQGEESNERLLARFRAGEKTVLAGTLSFWQGVDVKGGALSLVVVDKIPFARPDDPMQAAHDRWRRARGEDAFRKNQLPMAVTLMKQVAGRLLRDFGDYGVFAVCDPRLLSRGYGKVILRSLPPMPRAETAQEAAEFLQTMSGR